MLKKERILMFEKNKSIFRNDVFPFYKLLSIAFFIIFSSGIYISLG